MAKSEAITELKKQIKEKKLLGLYLFYGEETYLKELYTDNYRGLLYGEGCNIL